VRLDHLLSKEQLSREGGTVARGPRMSGRGAHMAETLASQLSATARTLSTCADLSGSGSRGGKVVWCGWWMMMSTLLSPERTTVVVPGGGCPGTRWLFFLQAWPGTYTGCGDAVFGVCRGVVGWSLVENCTVDASIFVVKLSRANGGCLGTRSR
jgi:hypothetical protein